jgi:glycosyltransferase involved in cell wall biosynthesis
MNNEVYVISCAYKANRFAANCIESVAQQTILPVKHFYIDDMSDDEYATTKEAEGIIKKNNYHHVELITNSARKHRLKNIHDAIQTIENPEAIVMLLDGDDWFSVKNAIEIVKSRYNDNKKLEYVYTNWMYSHNNQLGISKPIPSKNFNGYKDPWVTSAMATFKVKTFKSIPKSNFLDWEGGWIKMGTDQAYILPILYMMKERDSDYSAVDFINYPLYVYQFLENTGRPRSDSFGEYYRNLAHKTSVYIRERGFVDE